MAKFVCMKRVWIGIGLICLLAGLTSRIDLYPHVKNTSFEKGEVLDYRVNFGFFTVGHAITKVDSKIYTINSRPCYKVDAYGATSGMVSWVEKVDDQWGAYIDTAALVTHISYRKLKENHYRKDELITYDHENSKAEVKVMNKETGMYDPAKYYPTPEHVRDIMGGFTYLRVFDFTRVKKGDTISISGFFEDKAYKIKIIYAGIDKVHTKVGKIRCHKLIPIVPDNKIFDGQNSITTWLSADENQLLVKIHARMFVGSTGIELEEFKGLRNQLKIVEK
jgi:hypothetical protein